MHALPALYALLMALQREMGDLREQVSLYEGAQTVHSLFNHTLAQDLHSNDDTLAELGIKPLRKSSSCRSLGYVWCALRTPLLLLSLLSLSLRSLSRRLTEALSLAKLANPRHG